MGVWIFKARMLGIVEEGAGNDVNVQWILRTTSNSGNGPNIQCYNYNEKGHYARDCPNPRVRDSKYFQEQMLLAKKDEAGILLSLKFLIINAYKNKDLNASVCMMARIQPT
ncbi:retrovirus-related pol polyprotein from transposon TNT 1-94 [Tanacetum coccineum]